MVGPHQVKCHKNSVYNQILFKAGYTVDNVAQCLTSHTCINISQCIICSNYGTVKNSVWHNWLYTEWSEYPFITDSSLSSLIVWVRYTTCSSDDCYWHQLKTSSEWLWRCLTRWQQQCSVLFGKFYTHSDDHTLDKLRVTYLRWQNHWIEI